MAQIKTKEEIRNIRKACQITDQIFKKIISNFYFKIEKELALFIKKEIKKRGLRMAFPPIVTSGGRAGDSIHPKPTKNNLKGFVIIDFGVRVDKYCSDMTRTIYVGKPSQKEKKYYSLILNAKKKAEKFVFPNTKCGVVDKIARESLGVDQEYFIHTLGHGVGRRIHELPRIYFKDEKSTFKENMIITIEPGIYIPNILGIRIEDTYLVSKKGPISLTNSRQDLVVFDR
jgi:Xaa-Pro aminopeptidase